MCRGFRSVACLDTNQDDVFSTIRCEVITGFCSMQFALWNVGVRRGVGGENDIVISGHRKLCRQREEYQQSECSRSLGNKEE